MAKKAADARVVVRDIAFALLDVLGDWTYLCVRHYGGYAGRQHARYGAMIALVLAVCTVGTILSAWFVATSYGRTRKFKSLCFRCTLPKLGLALVACHHVPVFLLTTYIDLTLSGHITWAGWLNIFSSMLAVINTLFVTKCGEACGDGLMGWYEKEGGDDVEVGTLAATECDEPVGGDYKAMPGRTKESTERRWYDFLRSGSR